MGNDGGITSLAEIFPHWLHSHEGCAQNLIHGCSTDRRPKTLSISFVRRQNQGFVAARFDQKCKSCKIMSRTSEEWTSKLGNQDWEFRYANNSHRNDTRPILLVSTVFRHFTFFTAETSICIYFSGRDLGPAKGYPEENLTVDCRMLTFGPSCTEALT